MGDFIKIIKQNRVVYGEGIYLLYFAVMAGARAFGLLEGQLPYTVTLVIGMLLFCLKVVVTKHTLTEYVVMLLCMFVAGMVYLHSGEKGLIVCFSMMLGMKAVSKKKVIIVGSVVVAVMMILKVTPVVLGFADEIYYPQERAGVGLMFRHALGYAHPNTLHMNVLMLSLMLMYLLTFESRRLQLHEIISRKVALEIIIIGSLLMFGFNIYMFQYSGSRTGLLACIFFIACNIWLAVVGRARLFEKFIFYLTFPMACFLTIVVPLTFPDAIVDKLNGSVFMGRYWLDNFFWTSNRPVLWGQRLVHAIGHGMTYGLDSAQMYLFLQLGLVAFALMAVIVSGFMYFSIKANDLPELAVMETMLFIGLWEPLLYNLSFKNFTYVFIGYLLYQVLERKGNVVGEETVKPDNLEIKLGTIISDYFSIKKIGITIAIALFASTISFGIYNVAVQKPSALYGSREESENGGSLEMDPLYFTEDQIEEFRTLGDIVVGYKDELTPMYRYDESIALMEYRKKALSVGVWTGVLVLFIPAVVWWKKAKKSSLKL